MNDRELLELAARAIGIPLEWSKESDCGPRTTGWKTWNPLTDDGDAFRLAMKLDLKMHHGYTRNHVGPAAFAGDGEQFCIECHEDYTDGKFGAMRRTITRYAAEIGKRTEALLT
ncbi:hypothetical protein [Paraburkholderia sp. RL18-085-BIA-A]|uniref:hypothetical protein n=1 Tax=Paraburkholderia sp. RL18-085-BIA-A TaxID=3031633 RepID=UPI0038BA495C